MKKNLFRFLIMAAMVIGLTAQANNALAAVAANAPIINQATMTYDDGTGLQTINAEVTVTVTLVPSAPAMACPVDQSSPYTNPDTVHNYGFSITSTSNGPDDYTVSAAITGSTNTTLNNPGTSTPLVNLVPNPVRLGASITTSGSTATVIAVPSDSDNPSNGSINDIAVNDFVVINGEVRQVTAIAEDPADTNYITLNAPLTAVPLAGTGVYERVSFTVDIFSGVLTAAGTDITVDFDITATNGTDSFTCSSTSTFTSGVAVLTKFVRNLTDAVANSSGTGGQNFTIDGNGGLTYYTGGITAAPGDVLEYVLVAQNTGAAPLTSSQVNDVLPVDYVNFQGGQYTGATDIVYQNNLGVESYYTTAIGDDNGQLVGAALTVWVGTGAAFNTGGSIPPTSNVKAIYRVVVKP